MNLSGKMVNWGKWKERENKILIFSMGNDYEGHGPALPKDTDSRIAKYVATKVANDFGQRYCGHIPFQTDRVGDCASAWMPLYIPMEECAKKTIEFINAYCELIKDKEPIYQSILIINGHGGNNGLDVYFSENRFEVPVEFKFVVSLDIGKIIEYMQNQMKIEIDECTRKKIMDIKIGHADDFEHTVAAAIGIVDLDRLQELNLELAENLSETMKKYPVIGGLGGYIEYGDSKFDVLRKDKLNLVQCYQKLKEKGKIEIFPELGEATIRLSIHDFGEHIKKILEQK